MKNEVLEQVLNEILEENKKLREEQQFLYKAVEKQAEEINQFQEELSKKEIKLSLDDVNESLKKFHEGIDSLLRENLSKHVEIANESLSRISKLSPKIIEKVVTAFVIILAFALLITIMLTVS